MVTILQFLVTSLLAFVVMLFFYDTYLKICWKINQKGKIPARRVPVHAVPDASKTD